MAAMGATRLRPTTAVSIAVGDVEAHALNSRQGHSAAASASPRQQLAVRSGLIDSRQWNEAESASPADPDHQMTSAPLALRSPAPDPDSQLAACAARPGTSQCEAVAAAVPRVSFRYVFKDRTGWQGRVEPTVAERLIELPKEMQAEEVLMTSTFRTAVEAAKATDWLLYALGRYDQLNLHLLHEERRLIDELGLLGLMARFQRSRSSTSSSVQEWSSAEVGHCFANVHRKGLRWYGQMYIQQEDWAKYPEELSGCTKIVTSNYGTAAEAAKALDRLRYKLGHSSQLSTPMSDAECTDLDALSIALFLPDSVSGSSTSRKQKPKNALGATCTGNEAKVAAIGLQTSQSPTPRLLHCVSQFGVLWRGCVGPSDEERALLPEELQTKNVLLTRAFRTNIEAAHEVDRLLYVLGRHAELNFPLSEAQRKELDALGAQGLLSLCDFPESKRDNFYSVIRTLGTWKGRVRLSEAERAALPLKMQPLHELRTKGYKTEEEAALAVDKLLSLLGRHAKLNFPLSEAQRRQLEEDGMETVFASLQSQAGKASSPYMGIKLCGTVWKGRLILCAAEQQMLPEGMQGRKNLYTRSYQTEAEAAAAVDSLFYIFGRESFNFPLSEEQKSELDALGVLAVLNKTCRFEIGREKTGTNLEILRGKRSSHRASSGRKRSSKASESESEESDGLDGVAASGKELKRPCRCSPRRKTASRIGQGVGISAEATDSKPQRSSSRRSSGCAAGAAPPGLKLQDLEKQNGEGNKPYRAPCKSSRIYNPAMVAKDTESPQQLQRDLQPPSNFSQQNTSSMDPALQQQPEKEKRAPPSTSAQSSDAIPPQMQQQPQKENREPNTRKRLSPFHKSGSKRSSTQASCEGQQGDSLLSSVELTGAPAGARMTGRTKQSVARGKMSGRASL